MLPFFIRRKLAALRFWEVVLRLLWGVARLGVVVLVMLLIACFFDWLIDRFIPTPFWLRLLLQAGQIYVAVAAIVIFVILPLFRRLDDDAMALLVEEKQPQLNHRLISVVQFHRASARTEGMSKELIATVTEETAQQTKGVSFAGAADRWRLCWAAAIVFPALIIAVIPFLFWPDVMQALLARQALLNVDIPRSIYMNADNPLVRPKGEELVLRFLVHGSAVEDLTQNSKGAVRIYPHQAPSERYALKMIESAEEGKAVFAAIIPPGYGDFTYRAWLLDGRTEKLSKMKLVARPVVEAIRAWTLLPEFVGKRQDGMQYELAQPRGEIVAIAGASAKVEIDIQKPIVKAELQVLGTTPPLKNPGLIAGLVGVAGGGPNSGTIDTASRTMLRLAAAAGPNEKNGGNERRRWWMTNQLTRALAPPVLGYETILKTVAMKTRVISIEDKKKKTDEELGRANAIFTLPLQATAYRILVEDEYGFKNTTMPRRSIRIVPEEAPQVALLPEQFPPDEPLGKALQKTLDENYVDGAPVPSGSRFRIAYTATGPFGLGAARLHYRIFKKPEDDGKSVGEREEPKWVVLPLAEKFNPKSQAGKFDLRRGAFEFSPSAEQIEFHAIPSDNPTSLGRLVGGGRFDRELLKLLDGDSGKLYEVQPGDQIEYFIEVCAGQKFSGLRPMARSEVRLKNVVTTGEALQWVAQALQEESRVRQLEKKQKGVFSSN